MIGKIDNHNVSFYYNKDTKATIIYFDYNNNTQSVMMIYLNKEKKFLYDYSRYITRRQMLLLTKLLKKYNKILEGRDE